MKRAEEVIENIIDILIKSNSYVTLKLLSQRTDISTRSVQNYLVRIETFFIENGFNDLRITKKPGYGIILNGDEKSIRRLSFMFKKKDFYLSDDSVIRRRSILKDLLFSRNELTIQFLADKFYVSRTIIICDLKWVEKWLLEYELKFFKTQKLGIGIIGQEASKRNAIAGLFDMFCLEDKNVNKSLKNSSMLSKISRDKLEDVYAESDIKKVCSVIEEAENKFLFSLNKDYFSSLITHIIISISRLRSGNAVEKEFLPPEEKYPKKEMDTAEYIADKLSETFQIQFPNSEKIYICIHLIGYNTFHEADDLPNKISEKVEYLTYNLLKMVDLALGMKFEDDEILFSGLSNHLKASMFRLKENIKSNYYPYEELSDEGKVIYDVVKESGDLYKNILDVHIDERELHSIVCYFLLSLQRNALKKRALLVSEGGVISRMELCKFILDNVTQIEIIDVCTKFQIPLYDTDSYEFIITTVSLQQDKIPIIDISHIEKDQYKKYISTFLADVFEIY
jgi:transcriptional antiterminator